MVNEDLLGKEPVVERVTKRAHALGRVLGESSREATRALDRIIEAHPESRPSTKPAPVPKPNLSALDEAIVAGRSFERDMQELIDHLTSELEDLGRKVTMTRDYTTPERFKSMVSQRWANRSRLRRIRKQAIDGSMRTVLAYAEGTVASLNEQIHNNTDVYQALSKRLALLSEKLKDSQPRYEHWREQCLALEQKRQELEAALKTAQEDARPALHDELNKLQLDLDQARINETSYFEIVRNADEAMSLVRHHAEGFKQAIDALVRAKFKTAEKIDNLTEVFTGIYQIMETSLEMKGFSRIDQTINYAADKTTEAMNRQLEGILDEARERNSVPLIDDDKLQAYLVHMRSLIERYAQAVEEQRVRYASRHLMA